MQALDYVAMDYTAADYLARIENADIYGIASRTALEEASLLSGRLANRVSLKREDQQPTFSFKVRGAANKILGLAESEIAAGVICSSAGNHAQGVALVASKRGVPAHIVMPALTPELKVNAVIELGGQVELYGDSYDDAQHKARQRAKDEGLCFIHPFDDADVIAGQGTIGRELLDQANDIDAVFVPIGGGGLAAGISTYIKARSPQVKVYGVEPIESASMSAAIKAGKPVALDEVGSFADGVAVKQVGEETFRLCSQHLDGIITVSTDELCSAIRDIFEDTRTIVEPAGALAVAAIRRHVEETGDTGKHFVAINCGANMNFSRLGHVAERTALGDKREALLAVEIPEEKGSFLAFCKAIGDRHVTEFNYRRNAEMAARVFVGLELKNGAGDRHSAIDHLKNAGYGVTDLTENEMAKLHGRHLAGGAAAASDEKLFRFEFPERRGALLRFLESVGTEWNITLFHYRNHGSDYGRVLVAIEVPPATETEFNQHLTDLGYRFWDETDNDAYQLFLKG